MRHKNYKRTAGSTTGVAYKAYREVRDKGLDKWMWKNGISKAKKFNKRTGEGGFNWDEHDRQVAENELIFRLKK